MTVRRDGPTGRCPSCARESTRRMIRAVTWLFETFPISHPGKQMVVQSRELIAAAVAARPDRRFCPGDPRLSFAQTCSGGRDVTRYRPRPARFASPLRWWGSPRLSRRFSLPDRRLRHSTRWNAASLGSLRASTLPKAKRDAAVQRASSRRPAFRCSKARSYAMPHTC